MRWKTLASDYFWAADFELRFEELARDADQTLRLLIWARRRCCARHSESERKPRGFFELFPPRDTDDSRS